MHPRLQRRRVVHGCDDRQEAVNLIDLGADSDIGAAQLLVEVALALGRNVHGVRVVERANHRLDHRFLHRGVVRLVHEPLDQQVAHIDDRLEPLVGGAPIGNRQGKLHQQCAEQHDQQQWTDGFLDPHE